jgi:hypothetical protein
MPGCLLAVTALCAQLAPSVIVRLVNGGDTLKIAREVLRSIVT